MKPFRDWLHMTLPALLFIALRLAFRWAATVVAHGMEGDSSLIPLAAEALALTAAIGLAARLCPDEIAFANRLRACDGRCIAQCVAAGTAAGLLALWLSSRLGIRDVGQRGILPFANVCLLGPIAEEIVYRALVFERGKGFMPWKASLLASSLIFAVSHATPPKMLLAAGAGVLLGWVKQQKKAVLAPILIHGIMNGIQYLL